MTTPLSENLVSLSPASFTSRKSQKDRMADDVQPRTRPAVHAWVMLFENAASSRRASWNQMRRTAWRQRVGGTQAHRAHALGDRGSVSHGFAGLHPRSGLERRTHGCRTRCVPAIVDRNRL